MEGGAEKGRDRVRAGEPAAAAAPTMVSRSPLRDLRKKAARVTGAHHAFSPKKPRPSPSPPPELAAPAPEPLSLDDCARDEAAAEIQEQAREFKKTIYVSISRYNGTAGWEGRCARARARACARVCV